MIEFPINVADTPCLALIAKDGDTLVVKRVIVQADRRPLWRAVDRTFLEKVARMIDQIVREDTKEFSKENSFVTSQLENGELPMSPSDIANIRKVFVKGAQEGEENPFDLIHVAVAGLMKSEKLSLKDACHTVIGWAIDEGFIPSELREVAEQDVEDMEKAS